MKETRHGPYDLLDGPTFHRPGSDYFVNCQQLSSSVVWLFRNAVQ